MARGRVGIGPLRCVRGPDPGIVDVHFDGKVLVLVRHRGPLALLDLYRLVLLAVGILSAIAGWYAADAARTALFGVGAALAMVVALSAVRSLVTRPSAGTRTEVPEPDIDLMDPVVEGLRPLLVLYTKQGEIALTGWPWRASQLRRLAIELARE